MWSRETMRRKVFSNNRACSWWNLYRVLTPQNKLYRASHLLSQQLRPGVEPSGKPWMLSAQCFLPNPNGAKVEADSLGVFTLKAAGAGAAASSHVDDCTSMRGSWPTPSAVGSSTSSMSCANRASVEQFQIERAHPTDIGKDRGGVDLWTNVLGFAVLTTSLGIAVSIRWQPALPSCWRDLGRFVSVARHVP